MADLFNNITTAGPYKRERPGWNAHRMSCPTVSLPGSGMFNGSRRISRENTGPGYFPIHLPALTKPLDER